MIEAVEEAIADHTAGSPVDQDIRWTNRSPRELAEELAESGFSVCADTVRRVLTEDLGLGLRQAIKDEPASQHPRRDEQFQYIAQERDWYERRGWPVLSIDTKYKELLGNFFRPGAAYTDGVVRVLDHDFATQGTGRLVPYGVYDVARNEGLMLLTTSADTSALACDAIWRWWQRLGWRHYGRAAGMLVLCDCGGSNGYRHHRFKEELHWLAQDLQLPIQVAHYPPSCSKYNPIEHRMFCHVTRALRGVVLKTIDVAKQFMSRASTSTGLKVIVEKSRCLYFKGQKASRDFLEHMPIAFDSFLPELNYTARAY